MGRDAEFEAEREYSQYLQEEKEKEDDMASDFVVGKCGRPIERIDSRTTADPFAVTVIFCGDTGCVCKWCKRILELEAQLIDIKDLATRYDQAPVDTKDRPESWRRLDNLLIAAREGPVDE